ncbi:cytokinin dehydrogenase 2-like [Neltuma alba]|uniref:cytokinin dehydrogenase 2-like n=1 Tax=Neltuma alba TaxID=207710 RepID=UPI0010A567FC|nr:cytokinin dehydrogenase 2-like [Prosopis alba]
MAKPLLMLLWLITSSILVVSEGQSGTLSVLQAPTEVAIRLARDPQSLSEGSTDFGHIIHKHPVAIMNPASTSDISVLIKFSNSLDIPFSVAARGEAHSVNGQSMAFGGVVVNMSCFRNNNGGSSSSGGIFVTEKTAAPGDYVDVGGGQRWIDVLHETMKRGLSPRSWTDYLYLTVGGTLSNAGISGQTFRFGPQIQNVYELDVVTGKGEEVTCSREINSDLFYAVLGGLGQFGIITRARIALGPAPTRVKWLRLLYNDFSVLSADQERLISMNESVEKNIPNYVEGSLLLNQSSMDLSFYPQTDRPRITSLVHQNGIVYVLELAEYYTNDSQTTIDKEVEELISGLKFVASFNFEKDVSYEEFLDRVHTDELVLRPQGLWDLPHPWLNMFVPKSRITDFNEGVFKGILLKQNISTGVVLVYPVNGNKWDDRMSAMIPSEDVFYVVSLLHTSRFDEVEAYQKLNQMVLQFCAESGIQIKQYLPLNMTRKQWVDHFGAKWSLFEQRKAQYDPKRILSPGQGIFNVNNK